MAKSILLSVLSTAVGKYIDGINDENLKLGIWSGEVEFDNLRLKPSALDELHLPIHVTRGYLGKVRLQIPWATLSTNPVKVLIESLYLQASPLDVVNIPTEELKQRIFASKQGRLNEVEEAIMQPIRKQEEKEGAHEDKTFVQNLTEKVLDNLIVSIQKIHIRFEDSVSFPNTCSAVGITLNSFFVNTTDVDGNITFADRDFISERGNIIYKKARMSNVSIYCNAYAQRASQQHQSFEEWKAFMESFIYTDESTHGSVPSTVRYILHPDNGIVVNVENNISETSNDAKYSVHLHTENLKFAVSKEQLAQILEIVRVFSVLDRQLLLGMYRPKKRPIDAPKEWWKYAFILISGRQESAIQDINQMLICLRKRPKYIHCIMRRVDLEMKYPDNFKENYEYIQNKSLLDQMEEDLPLSSLIVFRQEAAELLAGQYIARKERERQEKIEEEENWDKFWVNLGLKRETVDGDVFINVDNVKDDDKWEEVLEQFPANDFEIGKHRAFLKANANIDTTLDLILEEFSIAQIILSSTVDFSKMDDESVYASFRIPRFEIQDAVTTNAPRPYLLMPFKEVIGDVTKTSPTSSLFNVFDSENNVIDEFSFLKAEISKELGHLRINLNIGSSELILNKNCIQKLVYFATPPSSEHLWMVDDFDPKLHKIASKYIEENDDVDGDIISIQIDVAAPKIVIPSYSIELKRDIYLYLDIGKFSVHASNARECFDTNAHLRGINALMMEDLPDYANTLRGYYIMEKFDIDVQIKTGGAHEKTTIVDIAVPHALQLHLNMKSLAQLLRVLKLVSSMFSKPPNTTKHLVSIDAANADPREDIFEYVNPSVKKVDMKFAIYRIALHVEDECHTSNVMTLSADGFSGCMVTRAYDMTLQLSLRALRLEDSSRFEHAPLIISETRSVHKEEPCLVLDILKIENVLSKMYSGAGLEIVAKLIFFRVAVDTFFLYRLEPYIQTFFTVDEEDIDEDDELYMEKYYETLLEESLSQAISLSRTHSNFTTSSMNSVKMLGGTGGKKLFRAENHELIKSPLDSVSMKFSVVDFELVLNNTQVVQYSISDGGGWRLEKLSPMFSMPIKDFSGHVESNDYFNAILKVRTLEIVDIRPMSANNIYKKVLGEDHVVSEDRMDHGLLTVSFSMFEIEKDLKFSINDPLIHISIDTLLDALDTYLLLMSALKEILSHPTKNYDRDQRHRLEPRKTIEHPDAFLMDVLSELKITVDVSPLRGTLIKDNEKSDSEAIIVDVRKFVLNIQIVTKLAGHGVETDDMTITLFLDGFSLSMTNNYSTHILAPLIQPFSMVLQMAVQKDKIKEEEIKTIAVHIEDHVKSFLSIGNIETIQNILTRRIDPTRRHLSRKANGLGDFKEKDGILYEREKTKGVQHYQIRTLHIHKIICDDLKDVELLGKNDPYIKLQYGAFQATTASKDDAGDTAVWNFLDYRIPIEDDADIRNNKMCIEVYDENKLRKNVLIGSAENIDFKRCLVSLDKRITIDAELKDLKGNFAGSLAIDVSYMTEGGPKIRDHFTVSLSQWTLTMINDIGGRSDLMLKVSLDDLTLKSTVPHISTRFEDYKILNERQIPSEYKASIGLKLEYYRVPVARWEPIVEHFILNTHAEFEKEAADTIMTVAASSMKCQSGEEKIPLTQINVSDVCLQTFLRIYNQYENDRWQKSRGSKENENYQKFIFESYIGVKLRVEDYEGKVLARISNENFTAVPLDINRRESVAEKRLKIVFEDDFGFMPLHDLPLCSIRPRLFYLRYEESDTGSGAFFLPIQEKIYENQRYDLVYGWCKPFLLGDPDAWTDSNGNSYPTKYAAMAPVEGWSWVGEGEIDLEGVGEEIDDEGWEYSSLPFSVFTLTSTRRKQHPLDVIRRRRWIITRIPIRGALEANEGKTQTEEEQYYVYWNVTFNDQGSRVLQLKSSLEIQNNLPFAIYVKMIDKSSLSFYEEVGPILEGSNYSIPILGCKAPSIMYRHAEMTQWSKLINYIGFKFHEVTLRNESPAAGSHINFVAHAEYNDNGRAVTLKLIPYVIVCNYLPFDVTFRCETGHMKISKYTGSEQLYRDPKHPASISERGMISSGHRWKLVGTDHKQHTTISFAVPFNRGSEAYSWSDIILIKDPSRPNLLHDMENVIQLRSAHAQGGACFISLRSLVNSYGSIELKLYTKYAVIDKTGLNMHIRSFQGNEKHDQVVNSLLIPADKVPIINHNPDAMCNLVKKPRDSYKFQKSSIGGRVYTDENHYWTHLPLALCGICMLVCTNEDSTLTDKDILIFGVNQQSVVFILFDPNSKSALKQVKEKGYQILDKRASAKTVYTKRRSVKGITVHEEDKTFREKINFMIAARLVDDGSVISFDGCGSLNNNFIVMVSRFELRGPTGDIVNQLSYNSDVGVLDAKSSWALGMCGLTTTYTDNDKLCFGVHGEIWSQELSLAGIGLEKRPFEIKNTLNSPGQRLTNYELAYSVTSWPGLFKETSVVKLMPRYCIVNCMDLPLEVRQVIVGADGLCGHSTNLQPYTAEPWHPEDTRINPSVQIKIKDFEWSLGTIDINEIGNCELLVTDSNGQLMVIHVDVKLASGEDDCFISVIIWESTPENASMKIKNDTNVAIYVRQIQVADDYLWDTITLKDNKKGKATVASGRHDELANRFPDIIINPQSDGIFGWCCPGVAAEDKKIEIEAKDFSLSQNCDQTGYEKKGKIGVLSFSKIGERCEFTGVCLDKNHDGEEIDIVGTVTTTSNSGGGVLVLHIQYAADAANNILEKSDAIIDRFRQNHPRYKRPQFVFLVQFQKIGISIIVDRPKRREFVHILLHQLEFELHDEDSNVQQVELRLHNIQVDNYVDVALAPVMLHSARRTDSINFDAHKYPFVRLTIIHEKNSAFSFFHLIEIIVLEFNLEIDSGTIFTFFSDFISALKEVAMDDDYIADNRPWEWIENYNSHLMSPTERATILDVYACENNIIQSKVYIGKLEIHPMEVTIGYCQTSFNRDNEEKFLLSDYPVLKFAQSIVAFDGVSIRINSTLIEDLLESMDSLFGRIGAKTVNELLTQLVPLAGNLILNLDMIGRPAGLLKNVGKGVGNFFYAPYKAAMKSPFGLISGISQGTSSLVSEVISGTLDSATTIVENATSTMVQGASILTGDIEFSRQQMARRLRNKRRTSDGGIIGGLQEGGICLFSGITSGVTDLVSKPLEGGKKGGVVGFFSGLGSGLVGTVVKPVVGLSSGMASVASGISAAISIEAKNQLHHRPARVFVRSYIDHADYVLYPLDVAAAHCQFFIAKEYLESGGKAFDEGDGYLDYSFNDDNSVVVLSEKFFWKLLVEYEEFKHKEGGYILQRRIKFTVNQKLSWGIISHFTMSKKNEIHCKCFGSTEPGCILMCKNNEMAMGTYAVLDRNRDKIGNAAQMATIEDIVFMYYSGHRSAEPTSREAEVPHTWHIGEITFGSVNGESFENAIFSEATLLEACENRFCGNCESLDPSELDKRVWQLVSEWCYIHNGFYAMSSRCCATLILNSTKERINIQSITLKDGRNFKCFGEGGYEVDSRSILPGGFVVIFAYGYTPTIIDKAHVKIVVTTTAFTATACTKADKTNCNSLPGYTAGFLEKSLTDWWSKNVLHVSSTLERRCSVVKYEY